MIKIKDYFELSFRADMVKSLLDVTSECGGIFPCTTAPAPITHPSPI